MVVGQAPGARGHATGEPYAGATGRTLRGWLAEAGFPEDALTERFYLTSVTKCFPGPSSSGKGDRAPSPAEIRLCRDHLEREIAAVRPELVLALGRVSISTLLDNRPLSELVGTLQTSTRFGHGCLVLPLPHPSGVSHWLNVPANRARLSEALRQLDALRIAHGW
jgi:uracil-DNA glycosylase family 4